MTAAAAIHLRPWRLDDAEPLVELFTSSADLAAQFPTVVDTIDDARSCITHRFTFDPAQGCNFAITVDGSPVGNVGVTGISRRFSWAWVSYFSSAHVRGRGLVKRSVLLACNWAIRDLEVFRLELGHRLNNPASGAVAEAAGFVAEGIERQKLEYNGERFDVRAMARLATDPFPDDPEGVTLSTHA